MQHYPDDVAVFSSLAGMTVGVTFYEVSGWYHGFEVTAPDLIVICLWSQVLYWGWRVFR